MLSEADFVVLLMGKGLGKDLKLVLVWEKGLGWVGELALVMRECELELVKEQEQELWRSAVEGNNQTLALGKEQYLQMCWVWSSMGFLLVLGKVLGQVLEMDQARDQVIHSLIPGLSEKQKQ
ncbi:unnamed protein product [Calypogeia fissa]